MITSFGVRPEDVPTTCPVIDDTGRKLHMYVFGKPTCLCGERKTPEQDDWNRVGKLLP